MTCGRVEKCILRTDDVQELLEEPLDPQSMEVDETYLPTKDTTN